MLLETSWDPYRFQASQRYEPASSSSVEERLKISTGEEAESIHRSCSSFLFSTSVGGGAPSELQAKVTVSSFITSSPGLTDREVSLGGSESGTKWFNKTQIQDPGSDFFIQCIFLQWTCRGMLVLLDLHMPPVSISSSTLQVRTSCTSWTRCFRTDEMFWREPEKLKGSTDRVVFPDSQWTLS